jgi:hypothetical protein
VLALDLETRELPGFAQSVELRAAGDDVVRGKPRERLFGVDPLLLQDPQGLGAHVSMRAVSRWLCGLCMLRAFLLVSLSVNNT